MGNSDVQSRTRTPAPRAPALYLFLAAIGWTSTIGQLVLMRELTAAFYGNELVFGLILAAWLAWVAVGAWGLARLVPSDPLLHGRAVPGRLNGSRQDRSRCVPTHRRDRDRRIRNRLNCSQRIRGRRIPMRRRVTHPRGGVGLAAGLAAAALLLPAEVALVRGSRDLLGVTPGALLPFGAMALTILLVLAPLCVLLGLLFTLGARAALGPGTSAGRAYVAESLGAVAGGALFSYVLVRWLRPFQVVLGVGALDLAVAALLARRGRWSWGAAAAALALAAALLGGRLERATLGWQYDGLRFARDSVHGRIVVVGRGEQRVFFENGLLFFETQGVAAEETAHLPLLPLPEPRRVLLIGGGVSGTLAEIGRHPSVETLHYVELDPLVLSAARAELPPDQALALDDPRVTLVYVDGRLYVDRVARDPGRDPFDAIVLDLPEPATGQLNRFYTREFFGRVRQILASGGVFALSLPWQENYPGPALQRLAASVYRTLREEFSEIVLLPGERLFMFASDRPLAADPALLGARLAEREIETRWVVPSYLDYLYTNDRVAEARALLEAPGGVRLNRDMEPICYYYDLLVWLSRFSGAGDRGIVPRGWLWGGMAVVLLGAVPLLRRRAVPAAIGLIGLAEMALEVVILFAFQVVHGYVYGQVGAIVTAFMAGLSAGGAIAGRWHWREAPAPAGRSLPRWSPSHGPRSTLAWLQGGIVALALSFPALLALSPPVWAFPLLALVAGGLTGLAFRVALACMRGQGARAVGMLYGADLVGGCVGSLLVGTLLVPILGIPQTCAVVALVGLAGILVLP